VKHSQKQARYLGNNSGDWLDIMSVILRIIKKQNPSSTYNIEYIHDVFASYFDCPHVFTYGAARMGLYEVLSALGISEGDEVILPGYTCAVVVNAVRFIGATPIYADIELSTLGADPVEIEKAITPKTKAIIAHHLFGIPCDIEKTIEIAKRYGIPVIEDAAMAIGGKLNGRPLGTFGTASIVSFQRTKMMSTGNGGLLLVHNTELSRKIEDRYNNIQQREPEYGKQILQQWGADFLIQNPLAQRFFYKALEQFRKKRVKLGKPWNYDSEKMDIGMYEEEYNGIRPENYPYRLCDDQAWLLGRQIKHLDKSVKRRNEIALELETILKSKGADVPNINRDNTEPSWLRYPFWVKDPEVWRERLLKLGIECGSWFEAPVHPKSCCDNPIFGYKSGSCKNGEWLGKHILNVPIVPKNGSWLIKQIRKI
jgi:dTDP-4-amino-4,6-dideoxygalactose transaminase